MKNLTWQSTGQLFVAQVLIKKLTHSAAEFRMIMKKFFLILFACFGLLQVMDAKRYPFDMKHSYHVQIVRVAQQGTKFLKAWGVAGSPDKAIVRAMQDAVAACIFTGVSGNDIAGKIPPLVNSFDVYEQHKVFFDTFFKKGQFLHYVKNVNAGYPFGEDNVQTSKGRKVGIYVVVMYDELRKLLENEGIVKRLNDYF